MQINWQKVGGLLPVVVQDASSGEVLMLAYMNEEAFKLTKKSGRAHYFSRTKGRIWQKGEESGNVQKVREMWLDCDNDTLLLRVEQVGVACHTGAKSCFFTRVECGGVEVGGSCESVCETECENATKGARYGILDRLYHTALERKFDTSEAASYVKKLYAKGQNGYLKKVCEEAGEFVLAVKDLHAGVAEAEHGTLANDVVYEAADVLFHMVVALADFDIHPERVLGELERREGVSGITEKASRITDNGVRAENGERKTENGVVEC